MALFMFCFNCFLDNTGCRTFIIWLMKYAFCRMYGNHIIQVKCTTCVSKSGLLNCLINNEMTTVVYPPLSPSTFRSLVKVRACRLFARRQSRIWTNGGWLIAIWRALRVAVLSGGDVQRSTNDGYPKQLNPCTGTHDWKTWRYHSASEWVDACVFSAKELPKQLMSYCKLQPMEVKLNELLSQIYE